MLLRRGLGEAEDEHLDLVELVDAEHAARVLAGGSGLPAEARGVAGVAQRQRLAVEDLAHVERGEGDLRGAGEVQVVALDAVDVDLVGRQEPGAVHRLLADEDGRQDGDEPARRDPVEREAVERQLEERRVAEAIGEARARDARRRAPCRSTASSRWSRGSKENCGGSPTRRSSSASSSVCRRARRGRAGSAPGRAAPRGGPAACGQLVLEAAEVGLDRLQLLELLRRRLALQLRLRAQLVGARERARATPRRPP